MRKSWSGRSDSPGDTKAQVPPESATILPLPTRKSAPINDQESRREPTRRGLGRLLSGVGRVSAAVWGTLSRPVSALMEGLPQRRGSRVAGRSARELILSAMKNRAMLRLRYEGHFGYLDVEPQGMGRNSNGLLLLWCYEIANIQECEPSGGWHLLVVADIVAAFPSGESYAARPWPGEMPFETLVARMELPEKTR